MVLFTSLFFTRMVDDTYVFQMSGIKNYSQKRQLLQGIKLLGGRYIGGSVSNVNVLSSFTQFFTLTVN